MEIPRDKFGRGDGFVWFWKVWPLLLSMQKASRYGIGPTWQFLGNMEKPDVDSIDGESTISIDKTTSKTPVLQ